MCQSKDAKMHKRGSRSLNNGVFREPVAEAHTLAF